MFWSLFVLWLFSIMSFRLFVSSPPILLTGSDSRLLVASIWNLRCCTSDMRSSVKVSEVLACRSGGLRIKTWAWGWSD